MSDDRKSWDKLDDETDEQYARFLTYRNLGPARSLDAAYQSANPIATNRVKLRGKNKAPKNSDSPRRASGQWTKDAVQFSWSTRAAAWDVAMLKDAGDAVACKYVSVLDGIYGKMLTALGEAKCKPGTSIWSALIESFAIVGPFIPKESFERPSGTLAPVSSPALGERQPVA